MFVIRERLYAHPVYLPIALTFHHSTSCPQNVFMCFVPISEQTAITCLYNNNWPIFVTERASVYCAVRAEHLSILHVTLSLQSVVIFTAVNFLTRSQANKTGAVASPSLRSAAVGLPMAADDDTKSRRSSTNWKASPTFRPYWNATSDNVSSAPASIAICKTHTHTYRRVRIAWLLHWWWFAVLSVCLRWYNELSHTPLTVAWSLRHYIWRGKWKITTATTLSQYSTIYEVGTLIVATIYLQLIQNRYTFRSFTVLQCSHQHCVQPVASDVEVVGYL